MKNDRKNKGITLIALIITIIIMFILVAVTINVVVNSGIIVSAKNAAQKTADEAKKEASIEEVTINEITYDSVEDYFANKPSSGLKVELEYKDAEVKAEGNVVSVVDGVPIPVGFVASGISGENKKREGLVIYELGQEENPEDVDWEADKNSNGILDVQEERNQFVWVPVLQNQIIKVESKEDITSIAVTDALNRTIPVENIIKIDDKTYKIQPTINGVYTVTKTIEEESTTETLTIHSLYAQDFWLDWYEETNVEDYLKYTDLTIEDYKESVNTYGGFYIARYEAGNVAGVAVSKKNQIPLRYIAENGAKNGANIYSKSTNVASCLINGAAWDRTLNFLVETEAITKAEMIGNSSSWGNYYNNSISDLTTENNSRLLNTGITDYTKRNNIYDLAGNLWEFTSELYSSNKLMERGGFCCGTSSGYPSANRNYFDPGFGWVGFRIALYIKTQNL